MLIAQYDFAHSYLHNECQCIFQFDYFTKCSKLDCISGKYKFFKIIENSKTNRYFAEWFPTLADSEGYWNFNAPSHRAIKLALDCAKFKNLFDLYCLHDLSLH